MSVVVSCYFFSCPSLRPRILSSLESLRAWPWPTPPRSAFLPLSDPSPSYLASPIPHPLLSSPPWDSPLGTTDHEGFSDALLKMATMAMFSVKIPLGLILGNPPSPPAMEQVFFFNFEFLLCYLLELGEIWGMEKKKMKEILFFSSCLFSFCIESKCYSNCYLIGM